MITSTSQMVTFSAAWAPEHGYWDLEKAPSWNWAMRERQSSGSAMREEQLKPYPIGSMYAIYGNICHQYTPNVSIYTIHGSYGYGWHLGCNQSIGCWLSHLPLWKIMEWKSLEMMKLPTEWDIIKFHGSTPPESTSSPTSADRKRHRTHLIQWHLTPILTLW